MILLLNLSSVTSALPQTYFFFLPKRKGCVVFSQVTLYLFKKKKKIHNSHEKRHILFFPGEFTSFEFIDFFKRKKTEKET